MSKSICGWMVVSMPDQAELQLRFEGGGLNDDPLNLRQDGTDLSVARRRGVAVENPAALAAPATTTSSTCLPAHELRQLEDSRRLYALCI